MKRLILGGALLAALGGCGGHAKEGDPCPDGNPQCADAHTLLECEETGTYRAINCPGPGGCVFDNNADVPTIACDLDGSISGDECPAGFEGFVLCRSVDAGLVCGGDIWRNEPCLNNPCQPGVGGVGAPESLGECD